MILRDRKTHIAKNALFDRCLIVSSVVRMLVQFSALDYPAAMDYVIVYASSVYSSTGVVELFLVTAFLLWYFNPR